ncbi:MAG: DNA-packaging protein [Allosphingosinicella sp.]
MTRDEKLLLRAVHRLAVLPPAERRRLVNGLSAPQRRTLEEFWPGWAHRGQEPPPGDWPVWLMVTGRGFGKTRAGAEWVSALARADGSLRIALVGATMEDARKVMVTGRSGLLAVGRTGEELRFAKTEGIVTFASGARAFLYSGACPEKLRGPEHHFAWCDELAKWRYPEETWDNLQLGLRLGTAPRALVTTTPKAVPLLKRLIETARPEAVTRGRTADNLNLPAAYVEGMEAQYRGTRKGREELDGELIEDFEGALWTRALIEKCRIPSPLQGEGIWKRIVIGVDPPLSVEGDACGIVACAVDREGIGHVLGDHSERGLSPEGWASKAVAAAQAWGADCVVVEKNAGGDMATSVLKTADPALPVHPVHARYGKGDRAEPVAMLFETGKARFAGAFPELEDELCAMVRGGRYAGSGSPDRADAMVYAMTELMLSPVWAEPRIRRL